MINLNDRPAMKNYYLLQKLPDYTHIKNTGKDIQKDTKYYTNKQYENQWNNKYRFSRKYLQFYHDSNDSVGLDKRMHLQELEANKYDEVKKQEIVTINLLRNDAIERLHERKMERINVQLESQQHIFNINEKNLRDLSYQNADQKQKRLLRKPQQNQHYLTGRAPTLWNEVHKTSQKHLDLSINQSIIDKDCTAVENITHRIEKDQSDENLRNSLVKANMEKTRSQFRDVCIKNYEFEQKVLQKRTSPLPNPTTRSKLEINRIRSKSFLDPQIIEQQRKEELKKQLYEDFLKQEKEYLAKINIQYESDKKKYAPQSTNQTQQIQGQQQSFNYQPNIINPKQQNIQTFGKASSNPETLNFSINNRPYLSNNRTMSQENRNIDHFDQNNQTYSQVKESGIQFSKSSMLENIKPKFKSSNATPIMRAENAIHSITSQTIGLSALNSQNINLTKEQQQFDQKNMEQTAIFGNTCISSMLEKPLTQINKTNESITESQGERQKIQSTNKVTPLKSSLKTRSQSQNNSEVYYNNNMQNSSMQYDNKKQYSSFNQDQSLIQDFSINHNLSQIQDSSTFKNDKIIDISLFENPYNPRNEIVVSLMTGSNEEQESNNSPKTDSQINNNSQQKKVNFNKVDSFLECNKELSAQNKDYFKNIEQQFSIDIKSSSQNATDFNKSTQSVTTASNFPLKYLKTPIIHKQNSHINYLSQPKQEVTPQQITDKFEYRGLLSGEVHQLDTKLNNSFVKTMTLQSQVVKDQTINSNYFRNEHNSKKRFHSSSKSGSTFSECDATTQQKSAFSYLSVPNNPERDSYQQSFQKFEDEYSTCEIQRRFPGKQLNEYRKKMNEIQKIKDKDKYTEIEQKTKRNYTSISLLKSSNKNNIHPTFSQNQQQNSRILS